MPFPKEWDSKVKVLRFSVKDFFTCHNCYVLTKRQFINDSTGLCRRCAEENRTPIERPQAGKCDSCNKLKTTNFGIIRDRCQSCITEDHPLRQCCIVCHLYTDDCWHAVCAFDREYIFLCENTGYMYDNANKHFKCCSCLTNRQQILRNELFNT